MSLESKTGIVFDDRMSEHECLWDSDHSEKPVRYSSSLQRCRDYGLIDRCTIIPSRFASEEELLLVHTKQYIDDIKSTKCLEDESDLEAFSSKYDSVYFNNKTYDSALLAAGSTLQLVSSVLNGDVKNGMAIVRPPGHHAMTTDACGFCVFNNVAIAAQYALKNFGLSKILIVDWDAHHGQATQYEFYDDPRVLYFSIHRYENGAFWPHLRESNFDYAGGDTAKGYNINVPLNAKYQGNAEYLAIFNNVLLPIAYEFSPDLVLISSGYDAALGCREGEMRITPQMYPHFINSLSCLAEGRICVVLEGGYCIPSLSEAVALTLRSLLGDPCPLVDSCLCISQTSVESVLNVLSVQRSYWDSIKLQAVYDTDAICNINKHFVYIDYTGNPLEGLAEFPTREYCLRMLPHVASRLESEIQDLILKTDLSIPVNKTCFVLSTKHEHPVSRESEVSFDLIDGARKTLEYFLDQNFLSKCVWLELDEKNSAESNISAVLNMKNINKVKPGWTLSNDIRMNLEQHFSPNLCRMNSDNLLPLVDAVMNRLCVNGFSLTLSGYNMDEPENSELCKFNEIALAACYLIEKHCLKRILIINWSVDHNNIQEDFYGDDKVLSISLHYCGKKNCPMSVHEVGSEIGKGYNVNIPFANVVSDGDYLAAVFHIILPIAYEYCPEFILISSTFNNEHFPAFSPSCYGIMTKLLSALCNGKMVIDIVGWHYDHAIDIAKHCISSLAQNVKVPFTDKLLKPCREGVETIHNVVKIQKEFWNCLAFDKALPSIIPTAVRFSHLETTLKPRLSSDPVAIPRRQDEPGTSKTVDWIGDAAGFDGSVELFCVTPLEYCPHLELLQPIPKEGLNPFARCNACNDLSENWVCLHCYQVYCGRFINQHMVQHGHDMQHFLTLSYSDLSVWCYACDAYIHNQLLVPIKEHAHDKKFGSS